MGMKGIVPLMERNPAMQAITRNASPSARFIVLFLTPYLCPTSQ